MQALNGVRVGAFIESGFFESRANHNSPIASRHQINLGRADDVTHDVMLGGGHGQHLSFDRTGREVMRRETARPRARAVHDAGRVVVGSIRLNPSDSAIREEADRSR